MSKPDVNLDLIRQSVGFRNYLEIHSEEEVDFELLGHGEYNLNYWFLHPHTGKKLVLRIPMESQMHLEHQVRYEFEALSLLRNSNRTPEPLYMDDTIRELPYGFLIMSFLPGESTLYEQFLMKAASCLADIHNIKIPIDHHLLSPENPLEAILEECLSMVQHYFDSEYAEPAVKDLLKILLSQGQEVVERMTVDAERCLINTELNSGNFLVTDEKAYLVDWEKPIYGHVGQDLGHFLAPTTTLWKTDTILTMVDINQFLEAYCDASQRYTNSKKLWEETKPYFVMNCLRGVTWCAMAYVEYQSPDRALKDAFTFEKIKSYLTTEFLEQIRRDYFDEKS